MPCPCDSATIKALTKWQAKAQGNARAHSRIRTPARQNLCRRYNVRSEERRYAQQEADAEHTMVVPAEYVQEQKP